MRAHVKGAVARRNDRRDGKAPGILAVQAADEITREESGRRAREHVGHPVSLYVAIAFISVGNLDPQSIRAAQECEADSVRRQRP